LTEKKSLIQKTTPGSPIYEHSQAPQPLSDFAKLHSCLFQKIKFVLCDIDDTLTDHGQLGAKAYQSLWKLKEAGVEIIPITGRPAGWCDMIARFWPVYAVVGENGAFYFRYDQSTRSMKRCFVFDFETQIENRKRLDQIQEQVLREVPRARVAADQFSRLMDLAIDICEDIDPLTEEELQKILAIFKRMGAHAKLSSIHINGWIGDYDKLTQTQNLLRSEFGLADEQILQQCIYIGDSPNDEPLWAHFPFSFGVQNVMKYQGRLKYPPRFITPSPGGQGFAELAQLLIDKRNQE
jgi:HAD superfamily hydrolase (TIGR01484 family)